MHALTVEPELAKDVDSRYPILRPCDVNRLIAEENYFFEDHGFSTVIKGDVVRYKLLQGCYVPLKSPAEQETTESPTLETKLSETELDDAERILGLTNHFAPI